MQLSMQQLRASGQIDLDRMSPVTRRALRNVSLEAAANGKISPMTVKQVDALLAKEGITGIQAMTCKIDLDKAGLLR
jgi:hypothetical protein